MVTIRLSSFDDTIGWLYRIYIIPQSDQQAATLANFRYSRRVSAPADRVT
jgi:hypothetical protein